MKKKIRTKLGVLFALILVAALVPSGAAGEESRSRDGTQPDNEKTATRGVLDIDPWSVDGGGGAASGGTFAIVAAVGQHDTGLANACGRVLDGGVWSSSVDLQPLFCDGFDSAGTGNWDIVYPTMAQPIDDNQTLGGE